MKLAEFNALCDREWAKPKRGDVVSLMLTVPSAAELSVDVLINGTPTGWELPIQESDLPAIRAGVAINRVVNPITRTVVEIRTKKTGTRESARVRVVGGTMRRTWLPASTETA